MCWFTIDLDWDLSIQQELGIQRPAKRVPRVDRAAVQKYLYRFPGLPHQVSNVRETQMVPQRALPVSGGRSPRLPKTGIAAGRLYLPSAKPRWCPGRSLPPLPADQDLQDSAADAGATTCR